MVQKAKCTFYLWNRSSVLIKRQNRWLTLETGMSKFNFKWWSHFLDITENLEQITMSTQEDLIPTRKTQSEKRYCSNAYQIQMLGHNNRYIFFYKHILRSENAL